jgi:hypothetical protein
MEIAMVSGIQLIGAIFALTLSYFSFLHYKRGEFTVREFIGWEVLWVGFVAATLVPERFGVFLGELGVIRAFDFFSVAGFIVVLSISFYTYVNVDRLRKKLEKTVRDLALADLPDQKKK